MLMFLNGRQKAKDLGARYIKNFWNNIVIQKKGKD